MKSPFGFVAIAFAVLVTAGPVGALVSVLGPTVETIFPETAGVCLFGSFCR